MEGVARWRICCPVQIFPPGFLYPPLFARTVESGLVDLDPWYILQGDELVRRFVGLRPRYADRELVPFARRGDRDDVACFDIDAGGEAIAVIEDFSPPGFEQYEMYPDFADWLRSAVNDFIEFED